MAITTPQDVKEEVEEYMDDNDDPPLFNKEKLYFMYSCISLLHLSSVRYMIAHKILRDIRLEIRTTRKKTSYFG